jgi:hypothetical protein
MRSTPLRLPRAGFPVLLLAVGLNGAAELAAQSTRVVPNVNTAREGSSAARTPFSHQQGRIQWLANGAELCQTSAVLLSLEMRLDGFNFNRAGQAGTVDVKAELYHVPFTPSTLTNVWTQNIGSATGQVVYNGTLNLPAVTQQRPLPNPFSLRIPLDRPFVYQRAQGNLLLDLQTSNGTSSDWPLDGIFISGSGYGSQAIKIWEEPSCSNLRGDSAKLSISSSQGALGQGLQVDHTVNPAPGGQLDLVMHWMGLSNAAYGPAALPLDLSGLGYQNCALATDILFTATTNGAGIVWPIPGIAGVRGGGALLPSAGDRQQEPGSRHHEQRLSGAARRPEHDPGGPAADGPSRALQRGADGLPLAERLFTVRSSPGTARSTEPGGRSRPRPRDFFKGPLALAQAPVDAVRHPEDLVVEVEDRALPEEVQVGEALVLGHGHLDGGGAGGDGKAMRKLLGSIRRRPKGVGTPAGQSWKAPKRMPTVAEGMPAAMSSWGWPPR